MPKKSTSAFTPPPYFALKFAGTFFAYLLCTLPAYLSGFNNVTQRANESMPYPLLVIAAFAFVTAWVLGPTKEPPTRPIEP